MPADATYSAVLERTLGTRVDNAGVPGYSSTQMLGRLRHADKEDARYTEYLEGDSAAAVVGKVFVTQGLAQLLVSAPLQLAAASPLPRTARRWLFPAGAAVPDCFNKSSTTLGATGFAKR